MTEKKIEKKKETFQKVNQMLKISDVQNICIFKSQIKGRTGIL